MSKILEATTLEALQCFNGKVDAADSSMDDANCSLPPRKPSRAKSRDQNAASPKSSTEVISGLTDVLSVQMETIVSHILNSPKEFKIPDSDTSTRAFIVNLAQYARKLEGMSNPVTSGVAPSSNPIAVSHSPTVPVKKTAKQIEAVADKLGRAAKSGIKKQMSWKPTCKSGTARWVYDGVCPDADVFAALLNLPEPPKWKQKKFAIEEFENALGDSIRASTRYSSLYLRGDVNVRWNPAAGEFKFSGSYGV